ncbi:hypothetical protein KBY82_10245 [Cyanobium sp. AMD-g]|uniref:DUF6629 family protein n=1 Tax=Cyanobium sp. AMD-g TaxID=2823699 RepID=UPI0020CE5ED8|nr:DUF6629 family protein [Cyanobium sp. AMD-g]MCP9931166.1 hypothetical protein [Cyanobium sp. AMD-g]
MCFSSSASLVLAAALLPLGVASMRDVRERQRDDLLPLAVTPLLFSLQQALEGVVWLGLAPGGSDRLTHAAALGYLFFAYAFWLVWFPWCGLRLNLHAPPPLRRRLLVGLLVLGLLIGGVLWLPLVLDPSLFQPAVVQGSLDYQTHSLVDPWINLGLGSTAYGVVVIAPLLLSASLRLRWFATGVLGAFLVAHLAFGHAFASVWCFFSALLSASLLWILRDPEPVMLPAGL